MRTGTVFFGAIGAIVIGVIFWLALFGVVQLNRPASVAVGPGAALAPAPAVPAQPQQFKVVATDVKFDQKEIRVLAGQPLEITLDNRGVLEHDFTIQNPSFQVKAAGGQTAKGTFTPTRERTYDFFCSIPGHREAGMVGKLIVGPAGAQ